MRVAALVLGLLGALASGSFGLYVLTDNTTAKYDKAMQEAKSLGLNVNALNDKIIERARSAIRGAYGLVAALVLGIAGGILALKGKGKIAAPVMLIAAIVPGVLQPLYFVFTALLLIGGILAFWAKPRASAQVDAPRPPTAAFAS